MVANGAAAAWARDKGRQRHSEGPQETGGRVTSSGNCLHIIAPRSISWLVARSLGSSRAQADQWATFGAQMSKALASSGPKREGSELRAGRPIGGQERSLLGTLRCLLATTSSSSILLIRADFASQEDRVGKRHQQPRESQE